MPVTPITARFKLLAEFMQSGSAGGIMLMAASAAAMIWANSPLVGAYEAILHYTGADTMVAAAIAHMGQRWADGGILPARRARIAA